jgi:hypothetical protein
VECNDQNVVVHATLDLHSVDTTTGDSATIHVEFQERDQRRRRRDRIPLQRELNLTLRD